MSAFLGVPVDAAYHLVTPFVSFLTPLLGGLAAAAAIVGFTVALRLLLLPLGYRAARGMQGAVFAGLFVLLAAICWLSAQTARRLAAPAATGGLPVPPGGSGPLPGADRAQAVLARVLPFATVPVAAFVPLAAGLYLATSAAWTLAERAAFGRALASRPAIDHRGPAG
jgi:YidC/Oxa1 family membrane protein insertase